MSKTKTTQKRILISVLTAVFALTITVQHVVPAFSRSLQIVNEEINQVENEIQDSEEKIARLKKKEDTLKNRLEIIATDIKKVQAQLEQTNSEIDTVQQQIQEIEEALDEKRELVQANAQVLYKEGNPSTLEVLFSSDSFTDFISRREYLDSVRNNLQEAAKSVVELQESLKAEHEELEELRQRQRSKQIALKSRRNEQQRLLKETRGEEEKYQQYMAERKEKLEKLRSEQAVIIANSQSGGDMVSGETDYPYMHSDCFDDDGRFNGMDDDSPCNEHVDPWSFYYHQCTSYVAWRRKDMGREIPAWGKIVPTHAKHFYDRADDDGYKINKKPAKGAIAVNRNGEWGHVMIVEKVYGEYIDISQFNAALDGRYSEVHGIPEKQWSEYWFIHDKS